MGLQILGLGKNRGSISMSVWKNESISFKIFGLIKIPHIPSMKHFIILFLCFPVLAFTQVPVLESEAILNFPDLRPESLDAFAKKKAQYDFLSQSNIPFSELSDSDQEIAHSSELEMIAGPFGTDRAGCSWYCAGSTDTLTASSFLPESRVSNYFPSNAHDKDLQTAWVEGKEGYGIGEEIHIAFELGGRLAWTHIIVYNGYCKSEKAWNENSRVKRALLLIDGEPLVEINLQDTYKGQRFQLGSFSGKSVLTLRILEVYPGDKYTDTAISEINFDGTGDH